MPSPVPAEQGQYRRMGCRGRFVAVLLGGITVVVLNMLMRAPTEVNVIMRYPNVPNAHFIGNLADSIGMKVQVWPEYDIPLGVRGDLFWHNTPEGFIAVDSAVFSDSIPMHTISLLPAGKENAKAAEFMTALLTYQNDTALMRPRDPAQKR